MEQTNKTHEQQIEEIKKEMKDDHFMKIKDVEEENIIILEGLKAEYEERLRDVKMQIL
jgi:VIT1/CCC1 family predicted Fe2+/Mn2+ transporter